MASFNTVREHILGNGGQIIECPLGKRFVNWNGKDVTSENYKVIIRFKGVGIIGHQFIQVVKRLEKEGTLDMLELGYSTCPKCKGTGLTHHHHVNNGICFKCNGSGYVE